MEEVQDGDTIKLYADVTVEDEIIFANSVVLDGQGLYTIKASADFADRRVIALETAEKTLELKALSEIGNYKTILKVDAFLGRNGITDDKKEGDGKTPLGTFELGLIFGTHNRENLQLDKEF